MNWLKKEEVNFQISKACVQNSFLSYDSVSLMSLYLFWPITLQWTEIHLEDQNLQINEWSHKAFILGFHGIYLTLPRVF